MSQALDRMLLLTSAGQTGFKYTLVRDWPSSTLDEAIRIGLVEVEQKNSGTRETRAQVSLTSAGLARVRELRAEENQHSADWRGQFELSGVFG